VEKSADYVFSRSDEKNAFKISAKTSVYSVEHRQTRHIRCPPPCAARVGGRSKSSREQCEAKTSQLSDRVRRVMFRKTGLTRLVSFFHCYVKYKLTRLSIFLLNVHSIIFTL